MSRKSSSAFTLAELLIALAILGEIATFTIPKIMLSQTNSQNNAKAKEAFSTVAAAYQIYGMNNTVSSSTPIAAISQYMNYSKVDSSSTLDGSQNDSASYSCSGGRVCLKMHNGSTIAFGTMGSFGGTNTTNMQWFLVDPDGAYTGNSSSIWGILYYNGRVTSWGTMAPNSQDGGGTYNPGNYDPSWFSW